MFSFCAVAFSCHGYFYFKVEWRQKQTENYMCEGTQSCAGHVVVYSIGNDTFIVQLLQQKSKSVI